jgi:exonuclease III
MSKNTACVVYVIFARHTTNQPITMNIATINVRGLNDPSKQHKFVSLCQVSEFDIVFVQETHIDTQAKALRFEYIWGGKIYWAFGTNCSAGVAIMFKPNFDFKLISSRCDTEGRIISVRAEIGDDVYNLVCIYAPVNYKQRPPFLEGLSSYLDSSLLTVLAGDFNCIKDPSIDYWGPNTRYLTHERSMLGSNIIDDMCLNFELLDAYRKKHPTQRSYTCVSQHVSGQSQSRLDRIFIPRCLYNMCSSIVVSPVSFSDHLSIALHLRTDTKNRGPGY